MFTEQGKMYNPGTKSNLINYLVKGTGAIVTELPSNNEHINTAVIVDVMHLIRKWSFAKGTKYEQIADFYKVKLSCEVPEGTTSIHFCCDRYQDDSLKSRERKERACGKLLNTFEVRDGFAAPDPGEFFAVSSNKANLQRYICDRWADEPMEEGITLHLSGGFQNCDNTVKVTHTDVEHVPGLESTHEEADQRIILHAIFVAEHEDVDRTIIFSNDTDVICMALYYSSSQHLTNLWIRQDHDKYMLISMLASSIGQELCRLLPFLHSIGGRDITSFLYGIGKGTWVKCGKELRLTALSSLGEELFEITDEMLIEAKQLLLLVYGGKLEDISIAQIRAQKFLNSKSTLLKVLPPTKSAFEEHIK